MRAGRSDLLALTASMIQQFRAVQCRCPPGRETRIRSGDPPVVTLAGDFGKNSIQSELAVHPSGFIMEKMSGGTSLSVEEYLLTSFDPECDFVDGEVVERNGGKRRHGYAQAEITAWFGRHKGILFLQPLTELRLRVAAGRVRIPDVLVAEIPI